MNELTHNTGHLESETIGAFVDAELSPADQRHAEQHLAECHSCTLRVLSATQLKHATAQAGRRFAPSADFRARVMAGIRPSANVEVQMPKRISSMRSMAWSGLAAVLVLAIGFVGWNQLRRGDMLAAELLDQHLATLSSGVAPQIESSDKHTVKPWFQGRIPFSFNLPEAAELPADTVLNGANLTYVQDQPAALLLFTIHKHQVSVLVMQRSSEPMWMRLPKVRSGFTMHSAKTSDLIFIGVSNVNADDLGRLIGVLVLAQVDR